MELHWHPIADPAGLGLKDALVSRRDRGRQGQRARDRRVGRHTALLEPEPVSRDCTSYEAGRAGCEAWSNRHYAALSTHDECPHLEWLAQLIWRGDECREARRRLEVSVASSLYILRRRAWQDDALGRDRYSGRVVRVPPSECRASLAGIGCAVSHSKAISRNRIGA
jgi:hypothetical protein